MNLVKSSLLNSISVGVRMGTSLLLNKILAAYVGPSGYATIGQFQNAISLTLAFASGAFNNGIVKYTAEYYDDAQRQHRVWRTACAIGGIGSAAAVTFTIFFHRWLSEIFLKTADYGDVFLCFAITLALFVFNNLLMAILTGKRETGRYVTANILGSVASLLITGALAASFGLHGTLIALAINQSVTFFITLFLCLRTDWFRFSDLIGRIDTKIAVALGRFTLMGITTAVAIPLSQVLIRKHLGASFGWTYAGYWEAMMRLSNAYLSLPIAILTVYYVPRMSEIRNQLELRRELQSVAKLVLSCAIPICIAVYLLRNLVITILFQKSFQPMEQLFAWVLIGDVLKIATYLFSFLYFSKALSKLYIFSESSFNILLILLVIAFTKLFGFVGASYAYALNSALYLIFAAGSLRWIKMI